MQREGQDGPVAAMERLGGIAMVFVLLASAVYQVGGPVASGYVAGGLTVLGLAAFAPGVGTVQRVFFCIAVALTATAAAVESDWQASVGDALLRASFIAAFFTALSAMRSAAVTDPAILETGRFLADQPPGRRYLALTLGGQLFGLVLTYGAISLLGSLAADATAREPNAEIRRHRLRRMLLAISRGFASTLPWSPLAFSTVITLTVVPGAKWADALPYCLASGFGFAAIGWAMDTIFKPRLSAPSAPRPPAEGRWLTKMRPLMLLMAVILGALALLHVLRGMPVAGAVMVTVPVIALAWIALRGTTGGPVWVTLVRRSAAFATREVPGLKGEMAIVVSGGFIGSLGASLIGPMAASANIDLAVLPAPVVLLCVFWFVPLTGQLGMNPILAVSLFGPLLPSPEAIGLSPAILVCAITSGWALSGMTSPFTASILMVGSLGRVRAVTVGMRWNGAYALVCGGLMSLWLLILGSGV